MKSLEEALEEAFDKADSLEAPLMERLKFYLGESRKLLPELDAAYDQLVQRIAATEAEKHVPGLGETMPGFIMADSEGILVDLADLVAEGPLVISFNRGPWCDYCGLELRATIWSGQISGCDRAISDNRQGAVESLPKVRQSTNNTWSDAARIPDMLIERLADHHEAIPTLVTWYLSEWEPYYGSNGPGDALADLEARCNRDVLPIGLVAIQDEHVLGTAALDLDITTNLTPAIVGLLVGANYRGRGIAAELVRACENLARHLRSQKLYVSTSVLGSLLTRLGWREMVAVQFLNQEHGSVYVRDL